MIVCPFAALTPHFIPYTFLKASFQMLREQNAPLGGKLSFAERQGFEPWFRKMRKTVFETVPFSHSGISPGGVNIISTNHFTGTTIVGGHELVRNNNKPGFNLRKTVEEKKPG
jgi:hypothetical protein